MCAPMEARSGSNKTVCRGREISHSIIRLETAAGQQTLQLSDTYDCITQKLSELHAMSTRFASLQTSLSEMVSHFSVNEQRFAADMEGQIKSLGVNQDDLAGIRALQRHLDLQRMAVAGYKSRLDAVEEKIGRQKELEVVWRQRASRGFPHLLGLGD